MYAKYVLFAVLGGLTMCVAGIGWSDVPAPPVNQVIGMPDILFGELTGADCLICHDSGVPDRHHLLYNSPIPPGSLVPYPDGNGDGFPDTVYGCLNCHDASFTPIRDCVVCHTSNAHHLTPAAATGDCVSCHGDIVDNMDDGHYIPSYPPSSTTPSTRDGEGLPLNSRGNGAGACNYCHDDDGQQNPIIQNTGDLHHRVSDLLEGLLDCVVCHDIYDPLNIRRCEECHGPDSLHNIQADSPNPDNIGSIVVGGEYAGYGHVGRDGAPGDSDCWGCHGFASAASVPRSGPTIPSVYSSDLATIRSGVDAMVTLTGASFTNFTGANQYASDVALTASDGTSVVLTPDIILDEGKLVITIPGTTPPGNYDLRAVKDEFASNPAVISIVPEVAVSRALASRGLTSITGSGFGGFAAGSGTAVTGTYVQRIGRRARTMTMEGSVVSWNDGRILVRFPQTPQTVTVKSVFGSSMYRLVPE